MKTPVTAVFDIGKTNKKLLLFDEQYRVVFEHTENLPETVDQDGFPCEDLERLQDFMFKSLEQVLGNPNWEIRTLNFSSYGASLVYLDENGQSLTPLYNYLKPYPEKLSEQFYSVYGGREAFAAKTASPVLGSLNSGMQLYRIKYERPELLEKIKTVLHLPQYLSYLITGKLYSDITSIGCHTNLWDFEKNEYHEWLVKENLQDKLAPLVPSNSIFKAEFKGHQFDAGIGLHDSSAALIPYLLSFKEPFILISTGTWCISLNPFNSSQLTSDELNSDCLCYLQYNAKPVKASRLFAGHYHEQQLKRITEYYGTSASKYQETAFDESYLSMLNEEQRFSETDLNTCSSDREAYHRLMMDIINQQKQSTELIIRGSAIKRIFVDGGFSKNPVYMNLLSHVFPEMEVFAASMAQATALGSALVISSLPVPNDLIELKFYSAK
ncbi:FGGY family carbohydrate kinase [Daejeonella sp. H1SJ63]|uniref:FGGY-family carbohydrate kinase n=1 Tax=Daejeonella sp. H1SJ63 TaxID=3034145 RepID=UPI0023EBA70C|nr:FGGY family carbohydrate kinase [Daejeonella sp. H1SJ63]